MNEAQLTTIFKNDLLESYGEHVWWYKVPDLPQMSMAWSVRNIIEKYASPEDAQKINAELGKTGLFRSRGQQKPFDVLCILQGRPVAIEFKKVTSILTTIPFNLVKDHQLAGLQEFDDQAVQAGGAGLIGVFSEDPEGIGFLRVETWREAVDRIGPDQDRKSFPSHAFSGELDFGCERQKIGARKRFQVEKFVDWVTNLCPVPSSGIALREDIAQTKLF